MRFVSGVKSWSDSSVTAKKNQKKKKTNTKILPPSSLHFIPFLIQLLTRRGKLHKSRFPLRLYQYITATFGTWISPEHRPLLSQTPFPASDAQRDVQINWKLQDILCQLPQWFSLILIWALFFAGSFYSSDLCLHFTCKYCQIFGTSRKGGGRSHCAQGCLRKLVLTYWRKTRCHKSILWVYSLIYNKQ